MISFLELKGFNAGLAVNDVARQFKTRSTQHAAYPTDRFTGNSDILGGRVNTAANPMTPQLRGNGDRRILDIETAFSIDWVHISR